MKKINKLNSSHQIISLMNKWGNTSTKFLSKLIVVLVIVICGLQQTIPAQAAVIWNGATLVKGQIGQVEILAPTQLWKLTNGKLVAQKTLKSGESYRVYQSDKKYSKYYSLGSSLFVEKNPTLVAYKTPSKDKLIMADPKKYNLMNLSLGVVYDIKQTKVADGVQRTQYDVLSSRGKQKVHVVNVNLKNPNVKIQTGIANGKIIGYENVLKQAERYSTDFQTVLAGVNGDYYDTSTGSPIDLMVKNGNIISTNQTPKSERVLFGLKENGTAIIGNPDVTMSMLINGSNPYTITSVNKPRAAHNLVLYTPEFSTTTRTNNLGTEVVLTNITGQLNGGSVLMATVKAVNSFLGSTPLATGELVLSGHGNANTYLQQLQVGDTVTVFTEYDQKLWSNVQEAIGGRYLLVKNGKTVSQPNNAVNPRTAVGIKGNGDVFMVVVDGRNAANSVGVTLAELAKLMKELGAIHAMTFDGGGSSTLVSRNDSGLKVINQPSDGNLRSVANTLLVVQQFEEMANTIVPIEDGLASIVASPEILTLTAGQTYQTLPVQVVGKTKLGKTILSLDHIEKSSNVGSFNADGSFTVDIDKTEGIIEWTVNGIHTSVYVVVAPSQF